MSATAVRRRGPGARRRPAVAVRRVQRPTPDLPVLHLEPEIPSPREWRLDISGLVGAPVALALDELRDLAREERVWDLHCVWGWSRPGCRWGGVPVSWLLDRARPSGAHVLASAVDRRYASCLTLQEARDSLIVLTLDGAPLAPEHGGPLRLVPPPSKWAYKGVKWVAEMSVVEAFTPGVWESLVGNPRGDVPPDMLDLRFEE